MYAGPLFHIGSIATYQPGRCDRNTNQFFQFQLPASFGIEQPATALLFGAYAFYQYGGNDAGYLYGAFHDSYPACNNRAESKRKESYVVAVTCCGPAFPAGFLRTNHAGTWRAEPSSRFLLFP